MTDQQKYYRVSLSEETEPSGFASAAIRDCMCCGIVLSGMGGGSNYLCQGCLTKMRTGEMSAALLLLDEENQKRKRPPY